MSTYTSFFLQDKHELGTLKRNINLQKNLCHSKLDGGWFTAMWLFQSYAKIVGFMNWNGNVWLGAKHRCLWNLPVSSTLKPGNISTELISYLGNGFDFYLVSDIGKLHMSRATKSNFQVVRSPMAEWVGGSRPLECLRRQRRWRHRPDIEFCYKPRAEIDFKSSPQRYVGCQ